MEEGRRKVWLDICAAPKVIGWVESTAKARDSHGDERHRGGRVYPIISLQLAQLAPLTLSRLNHPPSLFPIPLLKHNLVRPLDAHTRSGVARDTTNVCASLSCTLGSWPR